jgi:hypothetical protein
VADQLLTIEADASEVIAALERLGPSAARLVDAAARETAQQIVRGAQGRVRRATGALSAAITSERADKGGYIVYVRDVDARAHNLPLWHEFGTRYMTAQAFMGPAAALEEGPHYRRVVEAIADAIEGVGLGD